MFILFDVIIFNVENSPIKALTSITKLLTAMTLWALTAPEITSTKPHNWTRPATTKKICYTCKRNLPKSRASFPSLRIPGSFMIPYTLDEKKIDPPTRIFTA